MQTENLIKTATNMVCNFYNMKPEQLKKNWSKSRKREHIYPRQVLEYCLYNYIARYYPLFLSYPKIALITGTEHATVMNSVKVVEKDIFTKNDLGNEAYIIVRLVDRRLAHMRTKLKVYDPIKEITELQERIIKIMKSTINSEKVPA